MKKKKGNIQVNESRSNKIMQNTSKREEMQDNKLIGEQKDIIEIKNYEKIYKFTFYIDQYKEVLIH